MLLRRDLYIPVCAEKIIRGEMSILDQRGLFWLSVIGRPKLGISLDQVEARLRTLAPQVFEATIPPHSTPEEQESYRKRTFDTQMALLDNHHDEEHLASIPTADEIDQRNRLMQKLRAET